MTKKTPAQLQAEIDEALATPQAPQRPDRLRSLAHRLESVESELRARPARSKGRTALLEEQREIKRQIAGKPPSIPKWNERRGWHGGDRQTLYLFTYVMPYYAGAADGGGTRSQVHPGDPSTGLPGVPGNARVRIATRDEARRMWQNSLHSGWNVTD